MHKIIGGFVCCNETFQMFIIAHTVIVRNYVYQGFKSCKKSNFQTITM